MHAEDRGHDTYVPGLEHALEVGPRVFLRHPRPEDRAAFADVVTASDAFLEPWEPARPKGGDPGGAKRFDRLLELRETPHGEKMFICRREDGAFLGCININNLVRGVFESAALGYWIGAPFARRGYMADALQLALRRAFLHHALHRVEANIQPHNAPSIALVRRAGFEKEGYSRRYLKIAGRWADHERWALLAEDWEPRE